MNGMSLVIIEKGGKSHYKKNEKKFPTCQHPQKRKRQNFKMEVKLPTGKTCGNRIKKLSSVHPKARRNFVN